MVTGTDADLDEVRALYASLIAAWNARDAAAWVAGCDTDAFVIGFDGSQMSTAPVIGDTLKRLFEHHRTGAYVFVIRDVRFLTPDVALLRADSALVPAGATDLNPATAAIQTLTAQKVDGRWRVAQFQNTPAQFHGRPDAVTAFTEALRAALQGGGA